MEVSIQIIVGINITIIVPDGIAAMDINVNATVQPRTYTGQEYFESTEELANAEGSFLAEIHTTCFPSLDNNLICYVHL